MRVITALVAVVGISLTSVAGAGYPSLFATKVEPSPELSGIRVGLSFDEAKLAMRSFTVDDTYKDAANRTRMIKPAAGGAKYYVLLAGNVVSRIGIEAPEKGL